MEQENVQFLFWKILFFKFEKSEIFGEKNDKKWKYIRVRIQKSFGPIEPGSTATRVHKLTLQHFVHQGHIY